MAIEDESENLQEKPAAVHSTVLGYLVEEIYMKEL